jgi:hypothetical protein
MFENCGSKTFAGSFIDFGHMHPYFYSLFWNNTFTTIVCKIIRLSSKQQQQNQKLLLCVKFWYASLLQMLFKNSILHYVL